METDTKKEYRCTRRDPYQNPNCPGHNDTTARQGYYIRALNPTEALEQMKRDFPNDVWGFDVELHRVFEEPLVKSTWANWIQSH